jgi:hypothetical protein
MCSRKLQATIGDMVDNQRERLLSQETMAGLIMGEGWFGFFTYQVKRSPRLNIRPGFAITMNDLELMEWFIRSAEALGLPMHIQPVKRKLNQHRPGVRVEARGLKRTKRWLDVFLPLMVGAKREVAEEVAEFIESRTSKPVAAPFTEAELEMVRRSRRMNGFNANRLEVVFQPPKETYGRKKEAESSEATRHASDI